MIMNSPEFDPSTGEQLGLADDGRPVGLDSLTDFDIAWPTKSDTLMVSSTPGRVAALHSTFSADYRRADGFRDAAIVLAEKLRQKDSEMDALVFPFVYCWRHHIELHLKMLIKDSAEAYGQPLPKNFSSTHSLTSLWGVARDYIGRTFPNDPTAAAEVPNKIISQLAAIDPDGIALRYARTSTGNLTTASPAWIEVKPFHSAMLNLSSYLEGAIEGTSELASARDYW